MRLASLENLTLRPPRAFPPASGTLKLIDKFAVDRIRRGKKSQGDILLKRSLELVRYRASIETRLETSTRATRRAAKHAYKPVALKSDRIDKNGRCVRNRLGIACLISSEKAPPNVSEARPSSHSAVLSRFRRLGLLRAALPNNDKQLTSRNEEDYQSDPSKPSVSSRNRYISSRFLSESRHGDVAYLVALMVLNQIKTNREGLRHCKPSRSQISKPAARLHVSQTKPIRKREVSRAFSFEIIKRVLSNVLRRFSSRGVRRGSSRFQVAFPLSRARQQVLSINGLRDAARLEKLRVIKTSSPSVIAPRNYYGSTAPSWITNRSDTRAEAASRNSSDSFVKLDASPSFFKKLGNTRLELLKKQATLSAIRVSISMSMNNKSIAVETSKQTRLKAYETRSSTRLGWW